MTDHDPCVCPVCREAGMRNNPDKMIADLRRKNDILRTALERITAGDMNSEGCANCADHALGEVK